jgi:predicted RecA/RadA family phage recombinase
MLETFGAKTFRNAAFAAINGWLDEDVSDEPPILCERKNNMTQLPVIFVKDAEEAVDYTPSSAVTAGQVIIINGKLYIARLDITAGVLGAISPLTETPVWRFPKDSGTMNDREDLYWHTGGNPVGGTAGSGAVNTSSAGGDATYIGKAQGACLTGDTTCLVEAFAGSTVSTTYLNVIANVIDDPGTGLAIPVTNGGSVQLVLAGAGETNTLAAPSFAGEELLLNVKSVAGGGTRIVTVANKFDGTDNTITFTAAGQSVHLRAVIVSGATLGWCLIANAKTPGTGGAAATLSAV